MQTHEPLNDIQLREYSPLTLAYIGDAVLELMVRTRMVTTGHRRVKELHLETVEIVKAESQAKLVRQILEELSEAEQDIVRRGRNTKSTPPKNADPADYQLSTGFEALLGYLYLKGDEDRLLMIFQKIFKYYEK